MFKRREHQVGGHLLADRPADDAPAPDVEHDGQEDEAGPGRHVGHVGHPELVRARRPRTCASPDPAPDVASGSRRVVTTKPRRRLTPRRPAARISRATRLRPTRVPSSRSSAWMFGTAVVLVRGVMDRDGYARSAPRLDARAATALDLAKRRSHWPTPSAPDTSSAPESRPGSRSRVRRGRGRPPFLPANQAVAFARMSRSICNCRTWRRSRVSSSRSAVRQAFLAGQRLAGIDGRLRRPIGDRLGGAAELPRQFRRRSRRRAPVRSSAGEIPPDTAGVIWASWTPSFQRMRCPRNRVNSNSR